MHKILCLFIMVSLLACKRENNNDNIDNIPSFLQGKWVRGEFNMTNFRTYTGAAIQSGSLSTDAIRFDPDGTFELYTILFPTDAQNGCNPQKLVCRKGVATVDQAVKKVKVIFSGGDYREFYQNCPGKINVVRQLTAQEVAQAPLEFFYEQRTIDGAPHFALSYASGGPSLLLKKTDW